MTRFAYIADTHLGAGENGYCMQPRFPQRLGELISALETALDEAGGVDFLLHGGDLLDAGEGRLIEEAGNLFDLKSPFYLCLGNHDLTGRDSLADWLRLRPEWFAAALEPHFVIEREDCVVHVVPNHWEDTEYYWAKKQECRFSQLQVERLRADFERYSDRPNILCTHSPVYGIPPEQWGGTGEIHGTNPTFVCQIEELCAAYPQLQMVLGAHTHMNMLRAEENCCFATVSSFVETPFEFKIIDVSTAGLKIETIPLGGRFVPMAEYCFDRTYVQGRPCDRGWTVEKID